MNTKREKSPWINKVSSAPSPQVPVKTVKALTIRQALDERLPLPWDGKVLICRCDELNYEIFAELEMYGLKRQDIRKIYGFKFDADFYKYLKKIGVSTKAETALASEMEKPLAPEKNPIALGNNPAIAAARTKNGVAEKYSPKPVEIIPENIPTKADRTLHEAVEVHEITMQEREEFFAPDPAEDQISLDGWEAFGGERTGRKTDADLLSVSSKKIFVGSQVFQTMIQWGHCIIMVRPDGKQIALRRAKEGVKVGREGKRPALTCKSAIAKISALCGDHPKFRLHSETTDIIVWSLCNEVKSA